MSSPTTDPVLADVRAQMARYAIEPARMYYDRYQACVEDTARMVSKVAWVLDQHGYEYEHTGPSGTWFTRIDADEEV